MNKVNVLGWIYSIQFEDLGHGKYVTKFQIKTKKLVGKRSDYDWINCDIQGKKALAIKNNLHEGDRILVWARMSLTNDCVLSLAVDDIEFLY